MTVSNHINWQPQNLRTCLKSISFDPSFSNLKFWTMFLRFGRLIIAEVFNYTNKVEQYLPRIWIKYRKLVKVELESGIFWLLGGRKPDEPGDIFLRREPNRTRSWHKARTDHLARLVGRARSCRCALSAPHNVVNKLYQQNVSGSCSLIIKLNSL